MLTESEEQLALGATAPAFTLNGTDERVHSLDEYSGRPLLIIFMCNHCPFVKQKLGTINALAERYGPQGLAVVGINANDADSYPEDSFEAMVELAEKLKFDYLYDETQEVAKAYGATCTPDPFLFDQHHRLAWHGRLDDAIQLNAAPATQDMADAIELVLAGKPVDKPFLASVGCNIKWKT